MQFTKPKNLRSRGSMLVVVIAITGIFLAVFSGAITLALLQIKLNMQKIAQSQALQIAEAGVNNYRWTLYHDERHYFDTLGCDYDVDCRMATTTYNDPFNPGGVTGKYQVTVRTPKKNGSSVVTVTATGWTDGYPNLKKSIQVRIGKRSWASYSILSNSNINIESGTTVNGRMHGNSGIRVDGSALNVITSSLKKYDDPLHCGAEEYAVHSHTHEVGDGCDCPEQPGMPNECDRDERYDDPEYLAGNDPIDMPDVFSAGRSFPVPAISFNILGESISNMITLAGGADGRIIDSSICSGNCTQGFRIVLNNDNFSVYRVNTVTASGCINQNSFAGTFPYPENGIILVRDRDKLWIDGGLDNDRITVLAINGAIDAGNADIYINGNLTYAHSDGSEALGLIAQRNIFVDRCVSGNDLTINAAMITKKGQISAAAISPLKNNLTLNGSLATYGGFDFYSYTQQTCSCGFVFCCLWNCSNPCGAGTSCGGWDCSTYSGYQNSQINYDNNLTYDPPPHFPTTGEYSFISWKEE